MSNRFYGYDIVEWALSWAQDPTDGINAIISIINTERSLTGNDAAPQVKTFTDFWEKRNALPQLTVDLESSSVLNDEDSIGGGGTTIGGGRNPDKTPETYTVVISIDAKSNLKQFVRHVEIYGEAIYRVFHQYCDADIIWCLADSSVRNEVQTSQNETYKVIGYTFEIQVNRS